MLLYLIDDARSNKNQVYISQTAVEEECIVYYG